MALNNPIKNKATAEYKYTVDPAVPNGVNGINTTNEVITMVKPKEDKATLVITKSVDKVLAQVGEDIKYTLRIVNTGNVPANNVGIIDVIPEGTELVPNSLKSNVEFSVDAKSAINLTNPIAPNQIVYIYYTLRISRLPTVNPIPNKALVIYSYTSDPDNPDGVTDNKTSNTVTTFVPKYNFTPQITDIITSIASEQAAIANILDAEGRKIQAIVAKSNITPQELLCINKSVQDTIELAATLESILKQKLNTLNCQISGNCRF